MVVQHNMQAMNANRMLNITTNAQSKSTEKLSSGYKINRAADDAAGLAISEKMRKQIKGLDRASDNAQDGISAVQTAEGALAEVHDMLQRMNELAVQAANGTNSESDRQSIQDEIDQLTTEIDRVAETTKFNETYLLKGSTAGTSSDMKVNAHDAGLAGKLVDNGDTATFALDKALENGDKVTIAGTEYTIGNSADTDSTEGYAKYVSTEEPATTKLQAGDTITYYDSTSKTDKTATMVDKIEAADDWNAGTEVVITDEEGHELKYVVAAKSAAKGDGVTEILNTEIDDVIADALDKGHSVKMTKYSDGTNTGNVDWEVVDELEDDEIGADVWNTIDGTTLLPKGETVDKMLTTANKLEATAPTSTNLKSVTLGGEETVFTETDPMSADDFATAVSLLKAGDKLTVQDKTSDPDGTALTITIADTTDAKKNEYTVEDALKLVNVEEDDMDQVTFTLASSDNTNPTNKEAYKFLQSLDCVKNGSTVIGIDGNTSITASAATVVGSPTKGETAGDVISVNEAYAKITEELQKASSIGTDEGKEASVKNNGDGSFTITKGTVSVKDGLSFSLHVGADADMTNKIIVDIDSMSAAGLGIKGISVAGDTVAPATYAIDSIADAISKVSTQRSALGAIQNRLEHTISNLDNVVENTTSAESRIRDTDMAEEMVNYTKNNILAQAGQSMLAQANQSNQGVLSLLG